MQDATTTANLVEYETFEGGGALTAVLPREDLEAALSADEWRGLWLDIAGDDDRTSRLTIDMPAAEIEEILSRSTGNAVVLALDADAVAELLDEPDVEAHGIRAALAIAVVVGGIVAPAGLAATPQVSSAQSPQTASPAATAQVSSAAVQAQVSSAAKPQVSRAVAKSQVSRAARPQVSRAVVKGQVTTLVVKAGGVTLLKGGLAQ